jgi:hypothetical protein
MTDSQVGGLYLSKTEDYLGSLGAKLRDLRGFATLAHELIQNADDAAGASWICFNVGPDALIIDNDGVFSDCGQVESATCAWEQDRDKGHRCDFHRFRIVAGGDKRNQLDTIGAFGIGFVAVYQITDHPELISCGRHWILHEERKEDKRIFQCPKCPRCTDPDLPGTRFILPWARDAQAPLRQAFQVQPIDSGDIERLVREIESALPTSLLFLKRLRRMRIKVEGRTQRNLERVDEGDDLIIADGDRNQVWRLLKGQFSDAARALRERHGSRIERKRSDWVTLAIPDEAPKAGTLAAFLPTEHETGLSFYVNADFYTSSDRKKVIFESDYQSEWNRAALAGAADVLAANLEQLRERVNPARLWEVIHSTFRTSGDAAGGLAEPALGEFWKRLKPVLSDSPVVLTTAGEWRKPPEVRIFQEDDEKPATTVLESMGFRLVDHRLRPYIFQLPYKEALGMQVFGLADIVERLRFLGLDRRTEFAAAPGFLQDPPSRRTLLREVERLAEREWRTRGGAMVLTSLGKCAVLPGRDGAFWPCSELYWADERTRTLFEPIAPAFPFLDSSDQLPDTLLRLVPGFRPATAVQLLSRKGAAEFDSLRREGRFTPRAIIGWFEARGEEIQSDRMVANKLVGLPIYPSATGLRPLAELALPGNFEDPLGLADLVDLAQMEGLRDFLLRLGAKELTFKNYVTAFIPQAFQFPDSEVSPKRSAIRLLAERLGEIRDDEQVRSVLRSLRLVECTDGLFRQTEVVYFDTPDVRAVLGDTVHYVVLPAQLPEAVRELFLWLGVAEEPRPSDIHTRILRLTAAPPADGAIAVVCSILEHLNRRVTDRQDEANSFSLLRSWQWLPAQKGQRHPGQKDRQRWYRPSELYAIFSAHLFSESDAHFLDVPQRVQRDNAKVLDYLQVNATPSVDLVVTHLLRCAAIERAINPEVYRFLNENAADPAIERLRGKDCLLLRIDGSPHYVGPDRVFWEDHPFGRFRYRLGLDFGTYNRLLKRLEVRDSPAVEDAMKVLLEIAAEYGQINRPLDEHAHSVVLACWRMLEQGLESAQVSDSEVADKLSGGKVIPNHEAMLYEPARILFEDRAGLAAKFGPVLVDNVIARPVECWRAMAAAGVRSLADAVSADVVDYEGQSNDPMVALRARERTDQVRRVLHSAGLKDSNSDCFELLAGLTVWRVSELWVRYTLRGFGREISSPVQTVPAFLVQLANELWINYRSNDVPWASIARELAIALGPDSDLGALASGIKEVLAADSAEQARAVLDELGYPVLGTYGPAKPTEPTEVSGFGGEVVPEGGANEPEGDETLVPFNSVGGWQTQGAVETAGEAIKAILGPTAETIGEPPMDLGGTTGRKPDETEPNGRASNGKPDGHGRHEPRNRGGGRFVTYVLPEGSEQRASQDPAVVERRLQLSRDGIQHVMAFERRAGRHPKEMPENNRGYDIESRASDDDGVIERYIEVKALGDPWDASRGAELTRPEFETAERFGDRFWLYVVERADQTDFRIYRVQNPGRLADSFAYDHGWTALAEAETAVRADKAER